MKNAGFQQSLNGPNIGYNGPAPNFINLNTHWDYVNPFYVVDASITRGLSFPSWTTSEYYFASFDVSDPPEDLDGSRSGVMQGFGIDVPCFSSGQISGHGNVSLKVGEGTNAQTNLTTTHVMSNGSQYNYYSRYSLCDDTCSDTLRFQVEANPAFLPLNPPQVPGPYAGELVIGMTATITE